MAWSAPSTRTTGDLIDANIWNADVKANTEALRAGGIAIASQASGDVIYASSATQYARLGIGTANKILTSSGSAPQWSTQLLNAALPTNIDVGGTLDITGRLLVDSVGPSAIGQAVSGTTSLVLGGAFTSDGSSNYAYKVNIGGTLAGASGDTARLAVFRVGGTGVSTHATSETTTLVTSAFIAEPSLTVGSGSTVTNATALYIDAAPSGATNNYALWVDAGTTKLDGDVIVGGATNLGHTAANEAMVHSQITGTAGGFASFDNITDWGTNRWHVDVIGVAHTVTALTWKGYTAGYEGSAGGGAIVFGRDVGASWSTYCNIMTNDTSAAGEGALSGVKGFMVEPSGMIRVCGGPNTATAQIQMNPGSLSMADDASYVMSVLNAAALISVTYHKAGQARGALFWAEYHNIGIVKIADPDNAFDAADTDAKMCCYKTGWGSGDVTVKNRTGGTADVAVQVIRMQGL